MSGWEGCRGRSGAVTVGGPHAYPGVWRASGDRRISPTPTQAPGFTGADGVFPESWSRLIPLGSALVFLLVLAGLASILGGWHLLLARAWLERRLRSRLQRLLRRGPGLLEESETGEEV